MRNRVIAVVLAVVGLGGLGAAAWLTLNPPEPEVPPETAVRAVIADCLKAANLRDMGGITKHVAEDFLGPQKSQKQYLSVALMGLRNPELAVIFNPKLQVIIDSPTAARVNATLVFGRTKVKDLKDLPRSSIGGIYRLKGQMARRDGTWLFTGAEYETADDW